MGMTPLHTVPLPTGVQWLELRNEEHGIRKKIRVDIKASKTTRISLAL